MPSAYFTPPAGIETVLVAHPRSRTDGSFLVCPACHRQVGRLY